MNPANRSVWLIDNILAAQRSCSRQGSAEPAGKRRFVPMTLIRLPLKGLFLAMLMTFFAIANAQEPIDIAMITSAYGDIALVTPQGRQPLQPFARLKQGDLLALNNARLQIVYFKGGRQENWTGGGRLEVVDGESKAFGLPNAVVKILPDAVVKRISKTPAENRQGHIEVLRVRAIATPEAIEQLETSYRRMRMETVRSDLNPELFLLSGLFEMRDLERVEQVLKELQQARPGDLEVGILVAIYKKAIKNVQESRGS